VLIKDIKKDLAGVPGRLTWVRPGNIHLTLRFLGEVDEARLPLVTGALEEAASASQSFELVSDGLDAFPSMKRPRVLYLGLYDNAGLSALKAAIDRELAKAGFAEDDKPFRGHLTLCRVRSPEAAAALGAAAGALKTEKKVAFTASRFVLYKSDLSPKGARYSVIKDFTLSA
jgi:2'-5' RNA ligase